MNGNGHRANLMDHRFTFKTYLLLRGDGCFILLGTVNLRKLYKSNDEQNFKKRQNSLQTLTPKTGQNIKFRIKNTSHFLHIFFF